MPDFYLEAVAELERDWLRLDVVALSSLVLRES